MRRILLTALVTLCVSACREPTGRDPAYDRVAPSPSDLTVAEVDAVHRALFGVPASEIVQPNQSNPVDRNLEILRHRLDPQIRERDVERNLEILRRRIDSPSGGVGEARS